MRARLGGYFDGGALKGRFVALFQAGALLALLVLAAVPVSADEERPSEETVTDKGAAILSAHCGRCHAIGTTGDSPKEEAPPLPDPL